MNCMHRREDITPGIREGYRCVYRIGGVVRSGEIVVRPRETPLHFNTTPTSSAQSNDDDVANESQDLVGDGGRVLEIEAPLSLPPPQELSLDEILSTLDSGSSLSTQLDSGYGIAIASPSTNVNSARLSDSSSSNSSSNYGMALGGICLVPLVVMFLQFVKNVIVGRLSSRTRTNDSPSRLNADIRISIKTSTGYFALYVNVYDTVDSVQKKVQAWLELDVVPQTWRRELW